MGACHYICAVTHLNWLGFGRSVAATRVRSRSASWHCGSRRDLSGALRHSQRARDVARAKRQLVTRSRVRRSFLGAQPDPRAQPSKVAARRLDVCLSGSIHCVLESGSRTRGCVRRAGCLDGPDNPAVVRAVSVVVASELQMKPRAPRAQSDLHSLDRSTAPPVRHAPKDQDSAQRSEGDCGHRK